MFEYIDPFYFIVSFSIGVLYMYMFTPHPKVVIQYPTPYNLNKKYKSKNGNCYKYTIKKTNCPKKTNEYKI